MFCDKSFVFYVYLKSKEIMITLVSINSFGIYLRNIFDTFDIKRIATEARRIAIKQLVEPLYANREVTHPPADHQ